MGSLFSQFQNYHPLVALVILKRGNFEPADFTSDPRQNYQNRFLTSKLVILAQATDMVTEFQNYQNSPLRGQRFRARAL